MNTKAKAIPDLFCDDRKAQAKIAEAAAVAEVIAKLTRKKPVTLDGRKAVVVNTWGRFYKVEALWDGLPDARIEITAGFLSLVCERYGGEFKSSDNGR